MVVATHAYACFQSGGIGPVFRAGGYGVLVFFVVSAATLMLATNKRRELDVPDFAVRRIARVAPLYYAGILFYVAVHVMDNQRRAPAGILSNALFIHGFVPAFQNNVVPGGWSIGCEMAFYAIFPLLFRTITNVPRALGLVAFGLVFDVLMLVVDRASGWRVLPDANLGDFPVFLLPVFAAGIAVYHLTKNKAPAEGSRRWGMYGLALLAYGGLVAVSTAVMGHQNQAWQVIPTALFVGALVYACVSAPSRLLTNAFIVRLGLISYSVYIWHFAVLFGLLRGLPLVRDHHEPLPMLLAFVLTMLITWPIAELSRRFIELPGIALGRKLIARMSSLSSNVRPASS